MKTPIVITLLFAALDASAAAAQGAERVDPQTGNYVPVPDTFENGMPKPDGADPNRLNARISPRTTTGASAGASSNAQAPTVPVQSAARSSIPQAPSTAFVPSTFSSMGDMATYVPPNAAAAVDDPFAKPDWWPR